MWLTNKWSIILFFLCLYFFYWSFFNVCQAEVPSERVIPEAEKSTSTENGVIQTEVPSPVHSHSHVVEADTHTHEDRSEKEEELEFPHDLLPSIDLSTELDLTWGASLRYVLFFVSTDTQVLTNKFQAFLIAWNSKIQELSDYMELEKMLGIMWLRKGKFWHATALRISDANPHPTFVLHV